MKSFWCFCIGADSVEGQQVAEELRDAIASIALLPNRPVTASVGVATLLPEEHWSEWVKRSDRNLYRAKEKGRNRVVA